MAVDILELAQTAPLEIRQKFQQREYSEGDCIISPAAMPTCCLYIVLSGLLEVQKESGGGNAIVVNTFSAGDVFGEVEIFSPEYKPYAVRVKTACRILVLDKETVFQWMREVFDFDLFLCEMLTRRMYLTSDSMSRIALLPIRERVLGCIWSYYSRGQLSRLTKRNWFPRCGHPCEASIVWFGAAYNRASSTTEKSALWLRMLMHWSCLPAITTCNVFF